MPQPKEISITVLEGMEKRSEAEKAFSDLEWERKVTLYFAMKEKADRAKKLTEGMKKNLKQEVIAKGTKNPKGSRFIDCPFIRKRLMAVSRQPKELNEARALQILHEKLEGEDLNRAVRKRKVLSQEKLEAYFRKHPKIFQSLLEEVEEVDEEGVQALWLAKKLRVGDVRKMFDVGKQTFAFRDFDLKGGSEEEEDDVSVETLIERVMKAG